MAEQDRGKHLQAGQSGQQAPEVAGPARREGRRQPGGASPSDGGRETGVPAYLPYVKYFILGALLMAMAAAVIILAVTKLLPGKFMAVICVLLLVLLAVVAFLLWNGKKKGRFWSGVAVGGLLTVALLIGCIAGVRGLRAARAITSPAYTSAHIGVYVRQDDKVQALEELADRPFGIMDVLGRENVDDAIADLNKTLGVEVETVEYSGPTLLVNALFDREVDAVVMDAAHIEGLSELDEYKQLTDQMREITNVRVRRSVEPAVRPAATESPDSGSVFTALISGIDSRKGLVSSSLSDVNILVTVNTSTRQVLMVSTPRDFFVPFSNTGTKDKLTHAGWYGIDTCMGTIGALYDVDIDYYFRVNFEGFVSIIDALGGVTVESEHDFSSRGYHFSAGENTLNGEQALVFARERMAFIDGDRQRGRNQMAVIRAVMKKAMSPELLRNYSSLLDAVEGSFETTVSYDLISAMVRQQLDKGGDWNIVTYSVTGADTYATSPLLGMRVYVMEPDMTTVETAKDLMQQVRDGGTVTVP